MSTISLNNKKGKHIDTSKLVVRIVVWILVLAMLLGSCYTFIYLLFFVDAKETATETGGVNVVQYGAENDDDMLIRIALEYGSTVAVSFKTAAVNGFNYGYINSSTNVFTTLGIISEAILHTAISANLSFDTTTGNFITDDGEAQVGCYHLVFERSEDFEAEYYPTLLGLYPDFDNFEYYVDGNTYIMFGSFLTEEAATAFRSELIEKFTPETETETETETDSQTVTDEPESTGEDTSVEETSGDESTSIEETSTEDTSTDESTSTEDTSAEDTSTDDTSTDTDETSSDDSTTEPPPPEEPNYMLEFVSGSTIYKPNKKDIELISDSGKILWMFCDSTSATSLGLTAIQGESLTYISGYKTSGTRKYDGVLEFASIYGDGWQGIRVIDVLPLETYLMGVVPYEISSSWPLETQKAFTIAARSYAISHLGRHKSSYNADLCCTTNCQVYKGFGSTTARVRQAVNETKGMIAVCNGKICETYYSSSTGGCTANITDVWGSSTTTYPYLKAVGTPWEDCASHNKATWKVEYTPAELYKRLVSKGYALKSNVKSVTITLGNNTSYVSSVKVTDTKGNTVTISKNKIASAFGTNSANFVVGKAGETVTRRIFTMPGYNAKSTEPTLGLNVTTNPRIFNVTGRQQLNVLTASGTKSFYDSNSESVLTSSGLINFKMSQLLDSQYYPTIIGLNKKVIPDITQMTCTTETEEVKLTGTSGSFVFDGLGWGHGVGMSQFGAYDMGNLGYDYKTIFTAYFSGSQIMTYQEYYASK